MDAARPLIATPRSANLDLSGYLALHRQRRFPRPGTEATEVVVPVLSVCSVDDPQ
jgi:hypothetical protein